MQLRDEPTNAVAFLRAQCSPRHLLMAGMVVIFPPTEKAEPATRLIGDAMVMKSGAVWNAASAREKWIAGVVNPPAANWSVAVIRTVDAQTDAGAVQMPAQFDIEVRILERDNYDARARVRISFRQ
ncbi:hypothetical protein X636_10630 [Pandoraea pnomenusa]|nr:hypothetical protein X636_10630 [Pandoraea pnomenusa]